jgi:hypothetical protein
MLFPAAYVMMVIPQWVELPTARQAGEKTAKICRLDSIREPHEFVGGGRDRGWAGPSMKPTAVDYPSSTRDYAKSPAMPRLKRDHRPCPCRARRGVVNGRGPAGCGLPEIARIGFDNQIPHDIRYFGYVLPPVVNNVG